MPSRSITSCACSRLSGLEVRYGIRTLITLSLPSASTAKKAVSDESTPPDSPTIPLVNPRRRTTSSFRQLTSTRRPQHDLARRPHHHRPAREPLPPLEPDEARVRDVHAVLLGHRAKDPLPPHHARGEPGALLVHPRPTRGRRARHEDELRTLERRDRPGE